MDIYDRRGLKASARESLARAAYDPKKLILIHTGVTLVLSLVLALTDYLLERQIGGTGGLGGVGTRSVLETLQMALTAAQIIAVLFWQIGYVYAALRISRGQPAEPGHLLQGFRQVLPVLRLRLMVAVLYGAIGMMCVYLGILVFSFTPLADPVLVAFETGTEEAMLMAMEQMMPSLMCVIGGLMLVLMLPLYYRMRLAEYALMDDPRAGARQAIRRSRAMMRGNRVELLKLDLSFWWFYLCELLVAVVAYGDLFLPLLGLSLPWSATASYYVFFVLSCLCQLGLYWWKGNDVRITYAKFYEALLPKQDETQSCG